MGIVSVKATADQRGGDEQSDLNIVRTLSYVVTTDAAWIDQIEVMAAPGIPQRGDTYASGNYVDTNCVCVTRSAVQDLNIRTRWSVTCTFRTDVVSAIPEISIDEGHWEVALEEDFHDIISNPPDVDYPDLFPGGPKAFLNSAGDRFEEPFYIKEKYEIIRYTLAIPDYESTLWAGVVQSRNDSDIYLVGHDRLFPKGTLWLEGKTVAYTILSNILRPKISCEFWYRPHPDQGLYPGVEGWDHYVLDWGHRARPAINQTAVIQMDTTGAMLPAGVYLDEFGRRSVLPRYKRFRPKPLGGQEGSGKLSWAGLPVIALSIPS